MHLQDFAGSKPVTWLGLFLARHSPRWMGYGLARIAASTIVHQKPELYWTVRSNLRQIVGQSEDDGVLHEMARQVFYHAGQTFYDFFHTIGQPPEALIEAVRIPGALIEQIESEMARGQGVLVLGAHMSNFDMVFVALGAHRLPIQVLSLANPQAGSHILNRLRTRGELEITPITPESLRAAIRRLKNGGIVLTGVDRPIPQDRELVEFFGRPAYLPVGPVRLALMTGATVVVGACRYDPDEGYVLDTTWPVEMTCAGDRRQDVLINTRRIAAIVEGYVRAHPEQWMMFHPFWP